MCARLSCDLRVPVARVGVNGGDSADCVDEPLARGELEAHEELLDGGEALDDRLAERPGEVEEELELEGEGGSLEESLSWMAQRGSCCPLECQSAARQRPARR